jgi:hypothetical protein
MKMKKMVLVSALSCLCAGMASADVVSLEIGRDSKTITIEGGADNVANEIFTILDKAGAPSAQRLEGRDLEGKNVGASVTYLNGARYNVTLMIDSSSTGVIGPNDLALNKTIELTGDVAQELLGDMEKAGEPHQPIMDATIYTGKNITCRGFFFGPGRYSCTITVTQ